MSEPEDKALVAQILSSYLSNNTVPPAELATVIESVKRAFSGDSVLNPSATADATPERREPAVPIKKSISPNALTCLCCGDKFKSLKRHLQMKHQMMPREYREAFNLKADYPLVAPEYAESRSRLAKALGLGRKAELKRGGRKPTARPTAKKAPAAAE